MFSALTKSSDDISETETFPASLKLSMVTTIVSLYIFIPVLISLADFLSNLILSC